MLIILQITVQPNDNLKAGGNATVFIKSKQNRLQLSDLMLFKKQM